MLKISISGPIDSGPSWEKLDDLLRSMLDTKDTAGQFGMITRIARRDGQANYRDTSGVYDLDYRYGSRDGSLVRIELRVNADEMPNNR